MSIKVESFTRENVCEYCEGTTSKNMIDVAEQLH